MSDQITLANVAYFARHGLHPEEERLGQRFYVDLTVDIDLSAVGRSDDFADTVGYDKLLDVVGEVVAGERVNLIEVLADRIARAVLVRFDKITASTVTVRKPSAPVEGILDHVAVTVRRRREAAGGSHVG
jgi:dihydroneopterin aldolase